MAVAIVCLLSLGARAQDAGDRDAGSKIRVLENAWDQAQARGDIQALDLMFDSSMIYIDEAGSQLSKGEFLHRTAQEHRSGTLWVVSPAMSVKVYRDRRWSREAIRSRKYAGENGITGRDTSSIRGRSRTGFGYAWWRRRCLFCLETMRKGIQAERGD